MKIKKLLLIVLLSITFIFGMTSCKKQKQKLVVTTNAEFNPFEYVENGKITGFDIDLIRAYANKNDLELDIQDVDFDGALIAVSTGKSDLAIAGITVSEKRKETMSFSNSYYSADQVVIVKDGSKYENLNQDEILTQLSLDNAKIGCQRGTTGEYFIEGDEDWEFDGIKGAEVKSYDNGALAVTALSNGQIDAVIIDSAPARVLCKSIKNVKIVKDVLLTSEEYAIAVNKENTSLVESLNKFIFEAKEDGTLDAIVNKYFGTETEDVVIDDKSTFNKDNILSIFKGLGNTLIITFTAFLLGILLGVLVSLATNMQTKNKALLALKYLAKGYVMIFRGTPIIVQLLIIYYIVFKSFTGNAIWIGVLSFGLNSGAYVSEIVRGGIESVSAGQMEAGRSLGLNYHTVMKKIIFPQAIKNALPSLGNEFISLIKETSVIGFIGAFDLTLAFRKIANATYDYTSTYLLMGLLYFLLVLLFTCILKLIERRLNHDRIKGR